MSLEIASEFQDYLKQSIIRRVVPVNKNNNDHHHKYYSLSLQGEKDEI